MSINKEYLGRITKNVLKILDNEKITSLSDLDRLMNQTFLVDENTKEQVLVESRPSNLGTTTRVITYAAQGRGIPLEVRVNEELKYSKIIVKGDFNLPEYRPFYQDIFDNTAQDKELNFTDISKIKAELTKLL